MPRLLLVLFVSAALPAAADECYSVDPAGGSVSFELRQAGSPFRGAFHRFGASSVSRRVRSRASMCGSSPRPSKPRSPRSTQRSRQGILRRRQPSAHRVRQWIRAGADDRQLARGTLDIKGKRRNAEVPFRLRESGGQASRVRFVHARRLDYGIGTGEWSDTRWLGAEVKIDFSATLSRR